VLDFAHNHGVIHRDIKPSNLLVANSGRVYIADFGLAARWNAESLVHSPDASVLGTMHYIPPEVYAQAGRVCPAIDVYALGVTMYRLLTGKHPFAGATFSELQRAVLHDTVPLLKDVNPAVPEPLQRICLKAMERDPAERYQSAQQMADDLRRFLAHREVLARPTRYTTELEGLLQNHSTEIRSWQEKNLINITDMDRLLLSYRMLMTSDSPWRVLSREFPWESILMRLGGWFILLSSVLWLVFYWKDLDRAERIVSVAFPAVVLNGIGWLLQFLGSKWNARIFLSTGALLLPLLTIVCLTEYELAAASNYHSSLEERRSVELLDTGENVPFVTPSNIQLTLAFAAFVAYCSYLVKTTDARVFVLWLGLGLYLFATSALLVLGLKDWVFTDGRATTLSCYIVIAGAVGLLAMCLRAENAPHRAAVLFGFFPIPLAASLSALAHFGVQEWFKELTKTDQLDLASFWCMSNGLVYLGLASYCSRSTEGFVRFWGGFFILLVPLTVLIPCHLMFDRGELLNLKAVPESVEELLVIGDAAVTSYALLLGGFSVTFMAIGTWRALPAVTAPGVVGLGMFVMRFTERHFQDHVWWPTFLAIAGSAALLSGLLSSQIRSRKERNGSG
jgi:hypothetical protein